MQLSLTEGTLSSGVVYRTLRYINIAVYNPHHVREPIFTDRSIQLSESDDE